MKKSSASPSAGVSHSPLLQSVVRVLDEKKAEDLRVFDVRAQSSITDFLVLATGTSEPHLRTLRIELEKTLDQMQEPIVGVESEGGSGWTVFDAFEVMVHVFTTSNREKYRLELLWKDAREIPMAEILAASTRVKRRKKSHQAARKVR